MSRLATLPVRARRAVTSLRPVRVVLAASLVMVALAAQALELRVLSAGAVEPGIRPALAAFERDSGHKVMLAFAAAPALRSALQMAPVADVIVAPEAVLGEAASAPPAGMRAPIGGVGVAVAVREGAEVPDISSADSLKAALARAEVVVFNRASTGSHVETLLQRIGSADTVAAKAVRVADGAAVLRRLLAGSGREMGFAAQTEIVLFRDQGIRLVGPLPATLQNTTTYVAVPWPGAVVTDAARAEATAALVRHLQGATARAMFVNAGIEPAR